MTDSRGVVVSSEFMGNERGRRCNKASRERNMARRQQLPLRLQSSSISRGRQIKLLTQYPLYPYNKDKYASLPLSLFLSFLHSLQQTPKIESAQCTPTLQSNFSISHDGRRKRRRFSSMVCNVERNAIGKRPEDAFFPPKK